MGRDRVQTCGPVELADDPEDRVRDAQGWVSRKSGKCSAVPTPVAAQALPSRRVRREVRRLPAPLGQLEGSSLGQNRP